MLKFYVVLALSLFSLGCSGGPRTYPVSGTVKMDGAPLQGATVSFVDSKTGYSAFGVTNNQGEFVLAFFAKNGAPIGNYKVAISRGGPSEGKNGLNIEQVPARYNRATELTAQVTKEGPNTFSFDHLTSERDAKDEPQAGMPATTIDPAEAKAKTEEANDDALLKQLDPARDDRK